MQTEVICFSHDDYEVVVRTQDISYSWERFKGRIDYTRRRNPDVAEPEHYCRYASQDECTLRLYSPITGEQELVGSGTEWEELWPVVYETCRYQVRLRFKGVDADFAPEVRHVRKDIEESFFYDDEGREGIGDKFLTGEIDFLNEPGVFRLDFVYQKEGVRCERFISFDVVSPKLDTKNDYKTLLREVNEEYENVIYRYLSITLQQFSRGRLNTDATWMAAFQSVVEDYLKNVKRVVKNPHSRVVTYQTSRKAEQIKYWTPGMEERYAEVDAEGKLEEYYFNYEESHSTTDTMENRFVKHTLQSMCRRLTEIISTVLSASQQDLSERHRQMWVDYLDTLRKLSKHPFFKSVGRFDGMRQESLVLQSRAGYQQIYKDWLKLKRGIDLYNGAAGIGTLQIWEIYELWCFIRVKKLVAEVMGIDSNNPAHESLVTEPKGTLLNPFTNSSLEHIVEYRYPKAVESDSEERRSILESHEGDVVTLHYQHTFNRHSGKGDYGMNIDTATTEQRPDIVLNIQKQSGEVVLTYLYDAKYRVINDKQIDRDFEQQDIDENESLGGRGGDYPPTDAINQMHRYRDAIYYSGGVEQYGSKEVIGGYILFPGRGNDEHIRRRYYSESIGSVNIGAFPLLPNSDGLLREHLENILMWYKETETHVKKARPQRTLSYVTEDEKARMDTDDLVMVALAGSDEKRQWTFENLWYNIPLEKIADAPWMKAQYLLLHTKGEHVVGNICKIVRTRHEVWTKESLWQNKSKHTDYPSEPSFPIYFMLRIKKPDDINPELRGRIFDISKSPVPYWEKRDWPFYFVRLKDLME